MFRQPGLKEQHYTHTQAVRHYVTTARQGSGGRVAKSRRPPFDVMSGIFISFIAIVVVIALLTGTAMLIQLLNRINRRPGQWLRARQGRGKDIDELSRRLGVEEIQLRSFNPKYTRMSIPKRRGNGVRELMVPDPETKKLQRRILHLLFAKLRAHPAAMAFEKGCSIATNALPHAGQQTVVKLDVKDFFTTTKAQRVEHYFRRIGWNAEAAALLTKLCTHAGGLPQGAPTSPRLSNLVNYGLDASLARLAKRCRCSYTRYADDITFSMTYKASGKPGSLVRGVIQSARRRLKARGYEMHSRRPKLQVLRQHQHQRVTGLVVNSKVQLPRSTRRWLRAIEHRIATGRQATLTPAQLAGWQAIRRMIETQTLAATDDMR